MFRNSQGTPEASCALPLSGRQRTPFVSYYSTVLQGRPWHRAPPRHGGSSPRGDRRTCSPSCIMFRAVLPRRVGQEGPGPVPPESDSTWRRFTARCVRAISSRVLTAPKVYRPIPHVPKRCSPAVDYRQGIRAVVHRPTPILRQTAGR